MESTGGKKRRMGMNEEEKDDDDDNEEEKVEKFFALIRSTKEMRDRLRNANGSKDDVRKKRLQQEEKAAAGQWNPTFRPEDFMEDSISRSSKVKNNTLVSNNDAGPSISITQNEAGKETTTRDDDDDDGGGGGEDIGGANLDLNLSLSL